ncbi:hypothetical protein BC828DRAFT_397153 [Blastocladiella britannica]|nr:hypothetical protein BC828DRAFT_397153 [Blastocladiella britannica]
MMIDHVAHIILAHAASATCTPEQVIAVLNVLPQQQDDSVLPAVLSRGFGEFRPAATARRGHVQLLPHYPSHVLANNLSDTLATAARVGALPVLVKLWEIAGPTSLGRSVWFRHGYGGYLDMAVSHGHVHILEWLIDDICVPLKWDFVYFITAIRQGHLDVIRWALARGYLANTSLSFAARFAVKGDLSLLEEYAVLHPNLAAMESEQLLRELSGWGHANALEWWWETMANRCELPEPAAFAKITYSAIANGYFKEVQWWWDRFLEFRTPAHKFGPLTDDTSHLLSVSRVEVAEWLWQHSHESGTHWDSTLDAFSFSPDWKEIMSVNNTLSRTFLPSAPYLQWMVDKCFVIGKKLRLEPEFVPELVRHGHVDHLNVILGSVDKISFEWGERLICTAIGAAQFNVVKWWEANRDALPQQTMILVSCAAGMAKDDNLELVEWCHTNMRHNRLGWQWVCMSAIQHNSRKIQSWLRSRVGLFCEKGKSTIDFKVIWPTNGFKPAAFTLDFVSAIASNIGTQKLAQMRLNVAAPGTYWQCLHSGVDLKAMLLLTAKKWIKIFECRNEVTYEWWLQAHLAAGCPLVFLKEHTDKLARGSWLYDVAVTRKIPIMVQTLSDTIVTVPFEIPSQ